MSRRKNADKSTPWGYKRVYIEEQNRYVFVANKLVDKYQKNFLENFGRLKYPTVAECIGAHKNNKYFYVCDIKDAYGSLKRDGMENILAGYRRKKKNIINQSIANANFYIEISVAQFTYSQIKREENNLNQELREKIEKNITQDDIYRAWGEYLLKIHKNKRLDWFVTRYFFSRYSDNWSNSILLNLKKEQNKFNRVLEKDNIPALSSIICKLETDTKESNLSLEVGKKFSLDFIEYYFDIINFLSFEFHSISKDDLRFKNNTNPTKFFNSETYELILGDILNRERDASLSKDNLKILKHLNYYFDIPFYNSYFEIKESLIEKIVTQTKDELYYYNFFKINPELDNRSWYYDHRKMKLVQNFEYNEKISLFHEGGGLIQGSRCSPLIFEVVLIETIDVELKELCERYGLVYTRYRDDLIFSSPKKTIGKFLRKKIRKILAKYNFYVNLKKDKIVNLNKQKLMILGSSIDKNWNIKLTEDQLRKKIMWGQNPALENSLRGILSWEKYLEEI